MKINLLQYSFILFPIGGQSEFNRAILFIYYFSFKEITIHVHFWPTSHIHSLFLDLQSFVTQNHQHGSYACSWVCHFHWVLTNRTKNFSFSKGISDSALPYKRTVPSVSSHKGLLRSAYVTCLFFLVVEINIRRCCWSNLQIGEERFNTITNR